MRLRLTTAVITIMLVATLAMGAANAHEEDMLEPGWNLVTGPSGGSTVEDFVDHHACVTAIYQWEGVVVITGPTTGFTMWARWFRDVPDYVQRVHGVRLSYLGSAQVYWIYCEGGTQ